MLLWLIIKGLFYPFFGTLLGSAFVYFIKKEPDRKFLLFLDSFAAGIMCAASFFSLISPAIEQAQLNGRFYLVICCICVFFGISFFIPLDKLISRIVTDSSEKSGNLLLWAVSVHNIPEGMAVGVVYAGFLSGEGSISVAAALTLSVGIALQNIPEGAIISLPLNMKGKKRNSAFFLGMLSGVAELVAGIITLFLASFIYTILPFSLCFAAGAMLYVVMKELSRGFSDKNNSDFSLLIFATGFCTMMLLDTMLG